MMEDILKRNRKTVIILSIITFLSFICCVSLIKIAADKPESPEFCARCHSMESPYNTWKETVACNTACLDCHTHDNRDNTLSVEIVDNNCTKSNCHPVEKLTSEASKYKEVFSFKHETHLKEFATKLKIQCTGCHSYPGKDAQEGGKIKHFDIDENACFVCHFIKSDAPLLAAEDKTDIAACSLCHKDVQKKMLIYEKEFDHLKYEKKLGVECTNCHFETVHSDGGTDKKGCYYCHTKVPIEYTDTDTMHNDHVKKHNVPCSPCHNEINHEWDDEYIRYVLPERDADVKDKYNLRISGLGQSVEYNNLSSDSNEKVYNFDDKPYYLQKMIYRGMRDKEYEKSPDPMYLATVNCVACHKGKVHTVDPNVCNTCHEKGFDKTMLEQKEYVKKRLKTLSGLIKESQRQGIPKYRINEVKRNYNMIIADGSYGVHNIKYVKDLIGSSIVHLNLKKAIKPIKDKPAGPSVKAKTNIPIMKKEVKVQTKEISILKKKDESFSGKKTYSKTSTKSRTHIVNPGDTLWKLANKYYNNPKMWEKIYEANVGTIENNYTLKVGQKLIIPE